MAKEKEEKTNKNSSIHWYPGHMAKATREIEERVKLVDLIIELRDARAPLSTANPLIGAIKNKPHLIILTKIDMADPKQTDYWIRALKNDNQECMALNLTQFNSYQQIVSVSKKLLAEKMQKEQARGLKPRPVRAMVVGIPNVGKSTLINLLIPNTYQKTGDISKALGRGKHCTRITEYIKFNDGWIADSPGFSYIEFDLKPLELASIYPGFEKYEGECKFNDCLHEHEPGCAIKKAVEAQEITQEHYETYLSLLEDLKNRKERY